MNKPLELTVYEIDRAEPSMVVVDGYWEYRPHDQSKRLTEAEIAAEFHRSIHEFGNAADMAHLSPCPETWCDEERDRGWMYAMERFASLPHFDEAV